MSHFDRNLSRFIPGRDDRLTFTNPADPASDKAMRVLSYSGDAAILIPVDGVGPAETFKLDHLARLSGAGQIHHEPEYFLPTAARSSSGYQGLDVLAPKLSPARRRTLDERYARVLALQALSSPEMGKDRIKRTDESIEANMARICEHAAEYMNVDGDPEYVEAKRLWRLKQGPKPRVGKAIPALEPVSARALRSWLKMLENGDKWSLVDRVSYRGNHSGYYNREESDLLSKTINEFYLNLNRPTEAQTVTEVKDVFQTANVARAAQGLTPLRVPGRGAVRGAINSIQQFTRDVARLGEKAAMKRLKAVSTGLEVSRPFERVEIDECQIDLLTIMKKSRLMALFTEQELKDMGLDDEKGRWWLVFVVDCRTRMIVGMQLTKNPTTSAALQGLRMMLEDKGGFADAVGAMTVWFQRGKPETLYADNGVFKSTRFTDACADLGINLVRTVAGSPAMRGMIERLFRTAGQSLFSRLSGRVFSNTLERGDHPSEERACLDTQDLCFALVRWIVDIYHNTPHKGLGGLTPLQQWEADEADGNYPLHALPTLARKRVALGVHLVRKLQKDGITLLGVRYQSKALAERFAKLGAHDLNLRWDHTDIGSIVVEIDGEWGLVQSVHQHDHLDRPLDGLSAAEWSAAVRALRTGDKKRKEFDETVVFAALREIRAMNTARQLEFNIIDRNWNEQTFIDREKLFAGFNVRKPAQRVREADDGLGRSVMPRAPDITAPVQADAPLPKKRTTQSKFSTTVQKKD